MSVPACASTPPSLAWEGNLLTRGMEGALPKCSEAALIFPCGAVSLTSKFVWFERKQRALVEVLALEGILV